MSDIILRSTKGSALTNAEIDANFSNLNSDKIQSGDTVAALTITSATITGGSISGISDLAIADGGTGASSASAARTNLGLAIGTNVQAYSPHLSSLVNAQKIAGNFVVGNGTTWTVQSGAAARTSLGLGVLATANTINNSNWSGTVLSIANGGTGTTTATGTGSVVLASSPALTGNPTAPTQTFGNSSTRLATTAFVQQALQSIYPIGTIYTTVVPTNPASVFGFGTWVAFATGRTLVGIDPSNTLMDAVEETFGTPDTVNVEHTHTITDPGHDHASNGGTKIGGGGTVANGSGVGLSNFTRTSSNTTGITIKSSGVSGVNQNYQPSITVYFWKRTA